MAHINDNENREHNIRDIKTEFESDHKCTEEMDYKKLDNNIDVEMDIVQDVKKEVEEEETDQTINELGDTGNKIETKFIKTEYFDSEITTFDDVLDSCDKFKEPPAEDYDCTQNIDPLEIDENVRVKMEYHVDGNDQEMKKLGPENILKNDLNITAIKTEIDIKYEHLDERVDSFDDTLDACRITREISSVLNHPREQSSNYTEQERTESKKEIHKNSHKLMHTGEKPYACDICKKCFNQKFDLARHRRIHTGEKPYTCDLCQKSFSRASLLTEHKRMHTGEKPYTCDICKKRFSSSSYLATHKRIHTDKKPYTCDICKKSFGLSSTLAKHKRTHTGEKPYTCDICKKSYSLLSTLARHKRIHTGEKPYTCDICRKCFSQTITLAEHKRMHTGEKPYTCDICKKNFSLSSNLCKHKRIHTTEKM